MSFTLKFVCLYLGNILQLMIDPPERGGAKGALGPPAFCLQGPPEHRERGPKTGWRQSLALRGSTKPRMYGERAGEGGAA